MQQIQFSRGLLSIETTQQHPHWQLPQLIDFAERINPKRAFLFVSKVLGKHIPVAPSHMKKSYQDLAQCIADDLPTPLTMVAMAETAVGLGAGVFREIKPKYENKALFLTTTRHRLEHLPTLAEFLEQHSHAQDQCVLGAVDHRQQLHIQNTKTLVVVDDEISTGQTIINLIHSLQNAGLNHIERLVIVSLVNWSAEKFDQFNIPVEVVALLHGRWQWQESTAEQPSIEMPHVNVMEQPKQKIIAPSNWGREPSDLSCTPWYVPKVTVGQNILVLGSGEFSWIPFLVAEQLEQQGAIVHYSATTRSPIQLGGAIVRKYQFQDNYGMNIPNYVYNVLHEHYDRVILVIETAQDSIDPVLFKQIPNLEVVSYVN